jgi:lysyl-tRNA synthetase class 2
MTRATLRRGAGLGLGGVVTCTSWLLVGLPLTLLAFAATVVLSLGSDAFGRLLRLRRGHGVHVRRDWLSVPTAVVSWALAGAADLAAPAARAIRAARELHPLHAAAALAFDGGHPAAPWGTLIDVLVGVALVSSLLGARALRRPRPLEDGGSPEAFERARGIVELYGEDSLSPFVLRPDKSFEFAGGGVAAYRVIGETAVVSGDPVGPDGAAVEVLRRLVQRTGEAGLQVALYGASERHLPAYQALGFHAVCVGEEAVVNPARFTLEGRPVRKLRQSVHRVRRRGWTIAVHEGCEVDGELEAAIDALEAAWRANRDRMLGFAMSMGQFELGVRPDDVYALAWSPEGQLQATMRFLAHRGKLSLDTMRRVGETPNGLNEALVCHVLEFARARSVAEVSLNYAGLAHLIRRAPSGNWFERTLTRAVIKPLRARFQMDRLVLFNQKFSPSWRPRYLVYQSRAVSPRTAFRVLQAEGYVRQRRARLPRGAFESWRARTSSARVQARVSR